MITHSQDQLLQSAFAEARQDLEDDALTSRIMAKTRHILYMLAAGILIIAVAAIVGVWLVFGMPMLEFAVLISQFLTTTLIDLGEGWLALILMPVNNIASLFVIGAKAIHLGWKRVLNATFSN